MIVPPLSVGLVLGKARNTAWSVKFAATKPPISSPSFDFIRDIAPVAGLALVPNVLLAHPPASWLSLPGWTLASLGTESGDAIIRPVDRLKRASVDDERTILQQPRRR